MWRLRSGNGAGRPVKELIKQRTQGGRQGEGGWEDTGGNTKMFSFLMDNGLV